MPPTIEPATIRGNKKISCREGEDEQEEAQDKHKEKKRAVITTKTYTSIHVPLVVTECSGFRLCLILRPQEYQLSQEAHSIPSNIADTNRRVSDSANTEELSRALLSENVYMDPPLSATVVTYSVKDKSDLLC
ncbi:unnamed protein product [Didymodactylos carnosus]|uniref:Uncharacterized protein n=1 Tax=Didymodactylos carnosus TaxID=1234261 RepID=A0A813SIB3_9BILA|nr:unnamed protein product [Didymodactylos carnosus]CAF3582198.1 unnamed protein product [Didymodactylos carnosus]